LAFIAIIAITALTLPGIRVSTVLSTVANGIQRTSEPPA
jgi:hypothetical protein